jgi:phospholipase C
MPAKKIARKTRPAKKTGTKKRAKTTGAKTAFAFAAAPQDPNVANLDKIDHIVVLMMENRSFDHILGYLTLEENRTDVDGLTKTMHNDYKGTAYRPKLRTDTAFGPKQDPCHAGSCVAEQLQDNNGGFVSNYARNYPKDPEVDLPMNYYNGSTLKVFSQLVQDSCICDKWFCSVPGATWPNRLYSIAGQSGGTRDNKSIPIYSLPSFVRYLSSGKISWRWYAHRSPATLRLVDEKYRDPLHLKSNHFSYFDKHSLFGGNSFLEDAAQGKLAAVSWIDPDFGDPVTNSHKNENDDHPPVDMMAGQELILKTYNAITSSPNWAKTLLVILYDEHGGLFDHVSPPKAADDRPAFRQYGVRVPCFIVSPWVEANSVTHQVFDHTSLIKTILLKFCQKANGTIPDMGARVNNAQHLGVLLTRNTARVAVATQTLQKLGVEVVAAMAKSKASALSFGLAQQAAGTIAPLPPNDVQLGVQKARERLRKDGLPENQP